MNQQLLRFESIDELCDQASGWDDLWLRSPSTTATMRAACLRQWLKHFARGERFYGLAVRQNGQLVAGLPLAGKRLRSVLRLGGLPTNEWAASGELLLDTAVDPGTVLPLLVEGLHEAPWQILQLDPIHVDGVCWSALIRTLQQADFAVVPRCCFRVGQIDTTRTWNDYLQRLSKNHRRKMTKCLNRLRRSGRIELQVHRRPTPDEVPRLLRSIFQIEDRSWKGQAKTSVLKTAGMFDFITRQALGLLQHDELHLSLLHHDDRPIACAYGWLSKHTYSSYKIGYDPQFAAFSPGHLLRQFLLEQFAADSQVQQFDCLGPINEASQKWITSSYEVGRLMAFKPGVLNTALLSLYNARTWLTSDRRRPGGDPPVEAAGARVPQLPLQR